MVKRSKLSTEAWVRERGELKKREGTEKKVSGRSEKNGVFNTLLSPCALVLE